MRWLTFGIVVVAALTLQAALAPQLALFGARPDLLLVVATFFALYARPRDAVLGAWIIGLLADLMSIERLGFFALSYLGIALLVSGLREYLFRYRGTTQFAVTFAVGLVLRMVWVIYRTATIGLHESWGVLLLQEVLWAACWTAVFAPVVHRFLLSGHRMLGINRPRYSHAGMPGMA